jgi:hypothetical protein
VLGEEERVLVVLLQGVLHHLGILLQGVPHLGILLAALPGGGLTHLNGILGGLLLLPCVLGGSAWSGPIARYRATSSLLTCPVIGLMVPTGTGIVSVRLIGSLMFSDSANVCAIS